MDKFIKFRIANHGFLVGMLFEYILRVDASYIPITLFIFISISLILDIIFDYNKKRE